MTVLTVSHSTIKPLIGILSTDTSQDAAIDAYITGQQAAMEYALDPQILAPAAGAGGDPGLLATLTLGVTEIIGGGYVAAQGRNPNNLPAKTVFRISTLEIGNQPLLGPVALGVALAASGLARLKPFSRSARSLARTAAGGDQYLDDQSPVPLLLGSGLGQPGPSFSAQGPPADSVFDNVLGEDGDTETPTGDILSPGLFGFFEGGPE